MIQYFQAFFEVRFPDKTIVARLLVQDKNIDGDAHAKFLRADLAKVGLHPEVRFLTVADEISQGQTDFDVLVATLEVRAAMAAPLVGVVKSVRRGR